MTVTMEQAAAALKSKVEEIAKDSKGRAAVRFGQLVTRIENKAVELSRVDTGWYRANWRSRPDYPELKRQIKPKGKSFTASPFPPKLDAIRAALDKGDRIDWYFSNTVTYAAFLEARYRTLTRAVAQAAK